MYYYYCLLSVSEKSHDPAQSVTSNPIVPVVKTQDQVGFAGADLVPDQMPSGSPETFIYRPSN